MIRIKRGRASSAPKASSWLEFLRVGYHGELKVHLLHNIRNIWGLNFPKRLKVAYSTTKTYLNGPKAVEGSGPRVRSGPARLRVVYTIP